ncbi:DUF6442 family protein [Halobacillus salinus]|uniref:DUF6442 family protein n=1 Tax=Halobacillus salinus TaxID=192814 RepID=UPI0009A57A09|nr:DUF6442 family protein [Halobacillus salinus]
MKRMIYLLPFVGVALLAVGVYFIKTLENPQGILQVLPYLFVGVGCVIFGYGMGEVILRQAMKRAPDAAKQLEIDRKDERILAVSSQAKAKAYDMMVYVFLALIIAVSIMGIDLSVLLLMVFAYLSILVYNSYHRIKFFREI